MVLTLFGVVFLGIYFGLNVHVCMAPLLAFYGVVIYLQGESIF